MLHWSLVTLASALTWFSVTAFAADNHEKTTTTHDEHAGHSGSENAGLELDHGKKWVTDAIMRDSMTKIHLLVVDGLSAAKGKSAPDLKDTQNSETIKAEINKIIAGCKLTPKADATFHIILAELLGGVAALNTAVKNKANPAGAYGQMAKGLHSYSNFFDHPGFLDSHK